MTQLRGRLLLGDAFHAPERGAFEFLPQALFEIDGAGTIAAVTRRDDAGYGTALAGAEAVGRLVRLADGTVLLPGLVDLHVHAPQYPQLGLALDVPLETWLTRYTFPLEARYADTGFARRAYGALVADLLAGGTTTALYFATLHKEATEILVDLCLEQGQRALVGKVAMDHESCPEDYRDADAAAALAETRSLIDYVRSHPDNGEKLVLPVVTPRFIPACSDAALAGLGALAGECGCHVQTHCSESDWAHAYVRDRHGVSDAESLDRFGLLGRRTVLAHANFLSPDDMGRLAARGAAVAHCALSNTYFANAVFPLRAALERGVHVGLGTDISGGPSASMFEAQRMAVAASRLLEDGVDADTPRPLRGRPECRIDIITAFHLATAGGGEALDLPIGRFVPGCAFDALAIDTDAPEGTIRLFDTVAPADRLAAILYTASRANIARVWVGGRQVRTNPTSLC